MDKTKKNTKTNRLGKNTSFISVISLGIALIVCTGLIVTVSVADTTPPVCDIIAHPNGGPWLFQSEGYWIDMDLSTQAIKESITPQEYTGIEDLITVQPGETVQVKAIVDYRGYTVCPGCIMYQRVFASWEPSTVLADLFTGQQPAGLNYMEKTITFTAPNEPGEYKLHLNWEAAFYPPSSYCTNNMVETTLIVESLTESTYVDIKPGSCPNPLNPKSKGVLPVAILGTDDFDVTTIDPSTIQLTREGIEDGVAPIRWSYEDVATPYAGGEECGCHDLGGDGITDLTLLFDTQELVETLGLSDEAGNTIPLTLTGTLKEENGGTPIEGEDCVSVLKYGK